jgi:hypothetical protein
VRRCGTVRYVAPGAVSGRTRRAVETGRRRLLSLRTAARPRRPARHGDYPTGDRSRANADHLGRVLAEFAPQSHRGHRELPLRNALLCVLCDSVVNTRPATALAPMPITQASLFDVTPAQAGVQTLVVSLAPRLRGGDERARDESRRPRVTGIGSTAGIEPATRGPSGPATTSLHSVHSVHSVRAACNSVRTGCPDAVRSLYHTLHSAPWEHPPDRQPSHDSRFRRVGACLARA